MQANQPQDRYIEIRNVTLIGSVIDLVLGVAKIFVGIVGYSQALLADGIHSLSDLVTDFLVLYAAKHASREADEEHPYGHARIETMMTVVLGAALILVAIGIAYDAVRRMLQPDLLLHPGWMALVVATISIFSKEAIYHYTMHVAKKVRSNLLRANAWHSRSDAISSIIVLVGIIGSMAGLDYLDAVAAVGVALMIVKIGWDLAWHSVQELVDTSLDAERVEKIRSYIQTVSDVKDLHLLRTRRMGADALVDVHIQVDPRLSVSEGHQISETVRQNLIREFDEITDVMVHIDPEDDEKAISCKDLPLRSVIQEKLEQQWKKIAGAENIKEITLHYLDGKIDIELKIPLDAMRDIEQAQALKSSIKEVSKQNEEIGSVQVNFY